MFGSDNVWSFKRDPESKRWVVKVVNRLYRRCGFADSARNTFCAWRTISRKKLAECSKAEASCPISGVEKEMWRNAHDTYLEETDPFGRIR